MAARQILVICNPTAGKGRSRKILPRLKAFLESKKVDFDLIETSAAKNASVVLQEYDKPFTEVIVLGGDGTLNEVVNGLKSSVPIGVIPGGTGNDYTKNLCLGKSLREVFDTALSGRLKAVDVGRCNDRLFLNGVGIGFDGQVARHAEESDIWLSGWPEYYYHVLRNLAFFDTVPLQFELDGRSTQEPLFLLTVAKGTTFGGSFKLTPNAQLDDGHLTICKISRISVLKRLLNIHRLKSGSHGLLPEVEIIQAKKFKVGACPDAEAHLDGEYIGHPPFDFEVLPRHLNIRVKDI